MLQVALSKLEPDTYLDYDKLAHRLDLVKQRLGRPLTLSEKVLYGHLDDPKNQVTNQSSHPKPPHVLV